MNNIRSTLSDKTVPLAPYKLDVHMLIIDFSYKVDLINALSPHSDWTIVKLNH